MSCMCRRDSKARGAPGPLPAAMAAIFVVLSCVLATACSSAVTRGRARRERTALSPRTAAPSPRAAVTAPRAAATAALPPGAGRTGPPAAPAQAGGTGMALLEKAADAGSGISYQGVEVISTWGVGGNTTAVADVWHRSGGRTVTKTAETGASGDGQPYVSADTDAQAPEGVLGVTKKLVALLGEHYHVVYGGPGSADSRPAQVVEAWRTSGSLAARFWLDKATKLPLRREVFDSDSHLISEDVFIDLRLGAPAMTVRRASSSGPWHDRLTRAQLSRLRARGWPVPAALPDGLSLFDADEDMVSTGRVLDLGYSDGLSVISLFVQRGTLPARLSGWNKITLDGQDVYARQPDQRSFTWASHGFVYTVMAEAPPAAVTAAVAALPHNPPPGFWQRLSRGFGR